MKKIICALLILVMCLGLVACGDNSDSVDNTDKTFSDMSEPTHDHQWANATCTTPKICRICNITEGSATGHNFRDGVCDICGELKGSEGLKYELSPNGDYYIVVGYGECTDTEVVIPSTHEGIPVLKIGEHAFENCFSITKVTFNSGIQSVGYMAFNKCVLLASVVIPSSLTNFEGNAFENCDNLKKVEYLGSIEEWCGISFSGIWYANPCQPGHADLYINGIRLEVLEIPDTVTNISETVFSCVDSIKEVIIGDNVNIGSYAFWACQNLENVKIGKNAVLGDSAFYYCPSLKKVSIEEGLTAIPDDALNGSSIAEVYLPKSLVFIEMSGLDVGTVYYAGSEDEWNNIVIQEYNSYLTVKFNCTY